MRLGKSFMPGKLTAASPNTCLALQSAPQGPRQRMARFCHSVAKSCHTVARFCHSMARFCHSMARFCHSPNAVRWTGRKRSFSIGPTTIVAAIKPVVFNLATAFLNPPIKKFRLRGDLENQHRDQGMVIKQEPEPQRGFPNHRDVDGAGGDRRFPVPQSLRIFWRRARSYSTRTSCVRRRRRRSVSRSCGAKWRTCSIKRGRPDGRCSWIKRRRSWSNYRRGRKGRWNGFWPSSLMLSGEFRI